MSIFSRIAESIQRVREAQRLAAESERRAAETTTSVLETVIKGFNANEEPEEIGHQLATIPDDQLKAVGSKVFTGLLAVVEQQGTLSPRQERTLVSVANHLAVPPEMVTQGLQRLSKCRLLYDINSGNLPSIQIPGLMLHKGEVAHWSEPGAIIEERVVNRQYVGGYSGVSLRIMRGVYYRTGGVRGHVETTKGIVPTSLGNLVLTNQRLIFLGNKTSLDIPWSKVLNMDFYRDGIGVAKSGRSSPTVIKFNHDGNTDIIGHIISRIINQQ